MELPTVDYSTEFVNFWSSNFPNKKCPPLPSKPEQLALGEVMAMKENAPYLFENLFKPSPSSLPADVMVRFREKRLWAEDLEVIEAAGFVGTGRNMRDQIEKAEELILQKKIEESAARNAAAEKKRQEESRLTGWQRMMLKERTPQEIAPSRAEYGITQPF